MNWLLLEGALIVLSILLAFWIDAWWDDLQRAGLEREMLVSLTSDLVSNREQLSNIIHDRELGREALHEFLGMTPSEIAELSPDHAARIWNRLLIGRTFNAFDGAMRTDNLRLISDLEIRKGIGIWIGLANDVEEDSPIIIDGSRETVETLDLDMLYAAGEYKVPGIEASDIEILLRLREDEIFLKARLNRQRTINANHRKAVRLLDHTNTLLELIGANTQSNEGEAD